jgi:hypothetical protein
LEKIRANVVLRLVKVYFATARQHEKIKRDDVAGVVLNFGGSHLGDCQFDACGGL